MASQDELEPAGVAGAGAERGRHSQLPIAVLFDAVGTLIFADPPVAEVYQSIAAAFGSRLSRDVIRQRFLRALASEILPNDQSLARPHTSEPRECERWQSIVSEVVDDVSSAAAADLFAALWQHFAQPTSWRLDPEVALTWSELSNRGYHVAIASNFDSRLRTVLAGLPPLHCVVGQRRESLRSIDPPVFGPTGTSTANVVSLFISSEVGFPKPDPRFFRAVERQLGLEPSQILLVGDDWTNDIVGGLAAGWSTVWINRNGESPPQPVRSVTRLSDVLAELPQRRGP